MRMLNLQKEVLLLKTWELVNAEAAQVQGLGFSRGHHLSEESSVPTILKPESVEKVSSTEPTSSTKNVDEDREDENSRKKRKQEEKRHEKRQFS